MTRTLVTINYCKFTSSIPSHEREGTALSWYSPTTQESLQCICPCASRFHPHILQNPPSDNLPQNPSLAYPRPASQWGVRWKFPTLMLLFYSLAVGCGLGHHLLYPSLDGQVPKNQHVCYPPTLPWEEKTMKTDNEQTMVFPRWHRARRDCQVVSRRLCL
jgi:hypothetical protein